MCAIALRQACCQPVLQSSTEQWRLHFALSCAAVPWCWVTARLEKRQISIGVCEVTQAFCQTILQSITEQRGIQFALSSAALHRCLVTAHMYEQQISVCVQLH